MFNLITKVALSDVGVPIVLHFMCYKILPLSCFVHV